MKRSLQKKQTHPKRAKPNQKKKLFVCEEALIKLKQLTTHSSYHSPSNQSSIMSSELIVKRFLSQMIVKWRFFQQNPLLKCKFSRCRFCKIPVLDQNTICLSCCDTWNEDEKEEFAWEQLLERMLYEQERKDKETVCVCEDCGDPNGSESRANLCYDCEFAWQEYQVRHYSLK
jgi:hypothetical protein